MTMNNIRIGKSIKIRWKVSVSNGEPLVKEDLTLLLIDPHLNKRSLDFEIVEDDTIEATFKGEDQKHCGVHKLTLWYKVGTTSQSALDKTDAFRLVMFTRDESFNDEPIGEAIVDLDGRIYTIDTGIKIVNVSGSSIIEEGNNNYNNY